MPGGVVEIAVQPDTSGFEEELSGALSAIGAKAAGILAGALGGAALGSALASTIALGNEYTSTLNNMQGATGATAAEMEKVKKASIELGSDLTLPATSANDAAAAMTELAKGGFSVQDSMTAARGTLQLAAAAQIDAASAATIQSQALQAFGLQATDAGRAADVLANVANASSGEITDFASGLQQAGTVANSFGISIEDTATALGVFANAGITGSDAGTLLKSALLALTDTGKPAQKAIEQLGLDVYDAQGNFVGLRDLFGQLAEASSEMTAEQYQAATATLFGSDAARLSAIAAEQGAVGFDKMREAVGKAGGAAQTAAAKTAGLPGAIASAQSQVETFQLALYDLIDGPLEKLVESGTARFGPFSESVITGLKRAGVAVKQFSTNDVPGLTSSLDVVRDTGGSVFDGLTTAARNAAGGLRPVGEGLLDLGRGALSAGGPLATVGTAVGGLATAAGAASVVLVPLGAVVGGIASAFAALPGPVQSAVFALLALRVLPGLMSSIASGSGVAARSLAAVGLGLRTTVDPATQQTSRSLTGLGGAFQRLASPVTGSANAVRAFGQQMAVQRSLAASSGQSISRLGAFTAAFATSTAPAVAGLRGFSEATRATQAAAAATGSPIGALGAAMRNLGGIAGGLRSVVGGLTGALGGPFGIAILAAVVAFSGFSSASREATASAEALRSRTEALKDAQLDVTNAFTRSKGAINAEVFSGAQRQVEALRTTMKSLGDNAPGAFAQVSASIRDVGALLTGNTPNYRDNVLAAGEMGDANGEAARAIDSLGLSSQGLTSKLTGSDQQFAELKNQLNGMGVGGALAAAQLQQLRDEFERSRDSAATLTPGMESARAAFSEIAESAGDAAKQADALRRAFDALNGNTISAAEAQKNLDRSLLDVAGSAGEVVDRAQGYGDALVAANGQVNTSTENGQKLSTSLGDLVTGYQDAAAAASEASRAQDGTAEQQQAAARAVYDQLSPALTTLAAQYGLSTEQVRSLAAAMGAQPDFVETSLSLVGADKARVDLAAIEQGLRQAGVGTAIEVRPPDPAAATALRALDIQVRDLPNGNVEITAPTEIALQQLATIRQSVTLTDAQRADPMVGMDAGVFNQNNAQVLGLLQVLNASRADPAVGAILDQFNAGKAFTEQELRNLSAQVADPAVRARIEEALNGIGAVRGQLAGLQDRTVTITTVQRTLFQVARSEGIPAAGGSQTGAVGGAIGGIVREYAKGGVELTPMRGGLAQVVAPNTWRVIGDRVKDDEFYIPDNDDPRSLSLLDELARRRNMALVRRYAEGGVAATSTITAAPAPAAATASVNFYGNVTTQDVPEFVRKQHASQVRALAQFGIRPR